MIPVLAVLPFFSTLAGGLFALRYREQLNLILGFTAGVLLAVVAFDILPEITRLVCALNIEPVRPMLALVGGFLLFHIIEKALLLHHKQDDPFHDGKHPTIGVISALALIGHSFLDGVGIGLGFEVSTAVGILVAIAVISHDFSDGLNTVSLVLMHRNNRRRAVVLLVLDALAPVLGAISTTFFTLSESVLVLYLGFFAGFLLFMGATDILPEAYHQKWSFRTILMTLLGVGLTFGVTRLL